MKFIVSSSPLSKQLQIIGGVLNSSNTLPILDDFLFEVDKNQLTISASDLETTMTCRMDIESNDKGNIAIPARLLLDTLKTFPDQPLTFLIDNNKFGIQITSDYGKYKLSGHSGEEFPKIPVISDGESLKLKSSILYRALDKTIFATGNDELRPVMNGVLCEMSSSDLTFVATDAHKLVRYKRTDTKMDKSASFIIPKKPLSLLKGILPESEGDFDVEVRYNESNVFFSFENTDLVCRLVDGKYPNYDAVIPKDNQNKLNINRLAFLNCIKRVSIFANKTTHQVRLKVTGSELQVSAEDLDFANEANERLTCQYDGEDMEIGFNSRFLIEMLTNLDTEEVLIELSAPNKAGLLSNENGTDKNKDGEDLLMLVMPVMLNN
ncbi:MAG TPA: DNA polymerase III subunit beta [Flavobacteriales bacterium]|nr:DNA polymerase III subunit beta [Flavobacteriales bacterium]